MSQLNRDPNSDPHTMNNGLAVQNGICTVCGARIGNVNICPNCGAQQSRNPYAAGMANRSVQPGQALYSYCKVMLTLTAQWEKTADENAATDEELLNWVKIDYEKKTGIAVYPEYVSKSDDAYVIAVKDKDGNVLDTYTIDPKTGVGTNAASAEVNLPQTGTSGAQKSFAGLAALMALAGFGLVKKSRNKDDD